MWSVLFWVQQYPEYKLRPKVLWLALVVGRFHKLLHSLVCTSKKLQQAVFLNAGKGKKFNNQFIVLPSIIIRHFLYSLELVKKILRKIRDADQVLCNYGSGFSSAFHLLDNSHTIAGYHGIYTILPMPAFHILPERWAHLSSDFVKWHGEIVLFKAIDTCFNLVFCFLIGQARYIPFAVAAVVVPSADRPNMCELLIKMSAAFK